LRTSIHRKRNFVEVGRRGELRRKNPFDFHSKKSRDIVASVGPVSVVFCVQDSFYTYDKGVYVQDGCCNDMNHAMLITGYGTDPVEGDYW
jgi:hypothetical protein